MPLLARSLPTLLLAGALLVVVGSVVASAEPLAAPPVAPNYDADTAWLCRPGRADVCAKPTTATVFAAGRPPEVVTYKPDPAAPIDCFYVYPTVSQAPADNAPIAATGDEIGVARSQLARFSAVCRPFAPLYRQATLQGLYKSAAAPYELAYADVRAAWRNYLARDNVGRGFVLIGHSQGAAILAQLMAGEIDAEPIAARLVGAILTGAGVDVPESKAVGGTFRQIPLCTRPAQTGCVIAYASFLAHREIPADAHFGKAYTPGMVRACVDPAAVAGKETLDAEWPMMPKLRETYPTDFAELRGLLSAACTRDGPFSVLAVSPKPDGTSGGARVILDRLAQFHSAWGLHVLDIALAEGTLVEIVRRQAAAYTGK